jgi:ribosome-associated protein
MTDTRKTPPRKTPSRKTPARKAAPRKSVEGSTAPRKTPARSATARKGAAPASSPRPAENRVLAVALGALDDMKAVDVRSIDVRGHSDVTDFMVIASGNSDRHVRSIADRVVQLAKAGGVRPFGVEGAQEGEWVLVDLPDVMVHVMLPRAREFYQLEQLWESSASPPSAAVPAAAPRPRRRPSAAPGR